MGCWADIGSPCNVLFSNLNYLLIRTGANLENKGSLQNNKKGHLFLDFWRIVKEKKGAFRTFYEAQRL